MILNFTDFTLGRTSDLDSILHTIDKADKFIYIAIGEYIAGDVYKTNSTWRVIDDRLVLGIYNKHLNTGLVRISNGTLFKETSTLDRKLIRT